MKSMHPENPFPRKLPSGKVQIDERCTCGCLRSQHYDSLAFGHGSCRECICPKFTWSAHVVGAGTKSKRCEGHPAGPNDPMGQTVYCDGSCRRRARGK